MIPVQFTAALATGADDNGICLSQTPLAAGNMTIAGVLASGGVATLDYQRQVLFTFAADETGHNFTIYGTNQNGNAIYETVAGTATTAVTTLDYKTVTRIAISAAAAGAIIVGTNGVGASPIHGVNIHVSPINLGISCIVTGTVNYTFQYTNDPDPGGIMTNGANPVAPNVFPLTALEAKTATLYTSLTTPITGYRLKINSGTGSVKVQVTEAGIVG